MTKRRSRTHCRSATTYAPTPFVGIGALRKLMLDITGTLWGPPGESLSSGIFGQPLGPPALLDLTIFTIIHQLRLRAPAPQPTHRLRHSPAHPRQHTRHWTNLGPVAARPVHVLQPRRPSTPHPPLAHPVRYRKRLPGHRARSQTLDRNHDLDLAFSATAGRRALDGCTRTPPGVHPVPLAAPAGALRQLQHYVRRAEHATAGQAAMIAPSSPLPGAMPAAAMTARPSNCIPSAVPGTHSPRSSPSSTSDAPTISQRGYEAAGYAADERRPGCESIRGHDE